MLVEADSDGLFYGTGAGKKGTGTVVFYRSVPKVDATLESALAAALDWASTHQVDIVKVQRTPQP